MTADDLYATFPYTSKPSPDRGIDRLAVLSALYGLNVPLRPQVLEIGCSNGSNLIALALLHPHAHFVGFDRSATQIESATRIAREIGLENISFQCQDLNSVKSPLGAFDYILCHGLYSWIAPQSRPILLSLIRANLAPTGLASINFNCFPGWSVRGGVASWLQSFPEALDSQSNAAKARLRLLSAAHIDDYSPRAMLLREEVENLLGQSDGFFVHEMFNPEVDASTVARFEKALKSADLAYLADSTGNWLQLLAGSELGIEGEALAAFAQLSSNSQRRQFGDLLHPRSIRMAIVVREDAQLSVNPRRDILREAFISAPVIVPEGFDEIHSAVPVAFGIGTRGSVEVVDPLQKATLSVLAEYWPTPLSFSQFAHLVEAQVLASKPTAISPSPAHAERLVDLMFIWFAKDYIEISLQAPQFQCELPPAPESHPLARIQSVTQDWVSNYRNEFIPIHPIEGTILRLLTGQSTADQIRRRVRDLVEAGEIVLELPADEVSRLGGLEAIVSQMIEESFDKFLFGALIKECDDLDVQ